MENTSISTAIAKFRREKQVKQEELANYVGVSAQAVSKWENGGLPDTELLPKIADFFGVSIDTLFGRSTASTGYLWNAIFESIHSGSDSEQFNKAFEICHLLEEAIAGDKGSSQPDELKLDEGLTAQMRMIKRKNGFGKLYHSKDLSYALFLPDFTPGDNLFRGKNYAGLFADLADEKFFAALRYLMNRQSTTSFTENLLIKQLQFTKEEAVQTVEKLKKYQLLDSDTVEMDDEKTELYRFKHDTAFLLLLIFAKELPHPSSEEKTEPEVIVSREVYLD